jgi:cytochrome c556
VRFSIAQRDAAVAAIKAAESRDSDALSNASDALYETCDNCHKQYMKK